MPKYHVTVDGHDYLVEVPNPAERPVRAIVDGQVLEVSVASEMPAPLGSEAPRQGSVAPVVMTRSDAPLGQPVRPVVSSAGAPAGVVGAPAGVAGEVKAPLPGTIVGLSVTVGDAITHGQELCVLEAMKMNNPIRATQAGVVREVRVSIGQQVQHGAVLMVIAEG